jgi:membrane-associated phospholipid phosphatase
VPPDVLDSGMEILSYLSRFRTPWMNALFLAFSGIGSTLGYMVLFAILWWGVSWKLGAKLFSALVLSVYLNALLKDLVAQPRPFVYSEFESITRPSEFSFPSGHAQHAALLWTLLAVHFRKRWFTIVCAAMVFFIGFSRVYLGVHFPTDVLAGWLLGAVLAHAYVRWNERFIDWADRLSFEWKLGLAFVAPAALTLLHGTPNTAMTLGILAGTLSGLVLARRQRLYAGSNSGPRRQKRLVVGLIGLPLLYIALMILSPEDTSRFYYLYRWLRFAAIGLWISFLVPRIASLGARRAPSSPSEERGERAREERAST